MLQMASGGPRYLGVQYELDGIIHGLIANRDRRYVYGEVVYFKRWCVCVFIRSQDCFSDVDTRSSICSTHRASPKDPCHLCLHLMNKPLRSAAVGQG